MEMIPIFHGDLLENSWLIGGELMDQGFIHGLLVSMSVNEVTKMLGDRVIPSLTLVS